MQPPKRERNGGIGSCILTFDARVLFISVLIRSKNAHCGSYPPPVTPLGSLDFLFVVGLDVYLRCVERFNGCYSRG